jgi:hypothetical protein
VGVSIISCPTEKSQIMSIWKWPLIKTLFWGHPLSTLFWLYDENHVLDVDEEGDICVKKKSLYKKKQSSLKGLVQSSK